MCIFVSDLTDIDLDMTEQGDRIIAQCAAQVLNSRLAKRLLQNCFDHGPFLNGKLGLSSTTFRLVFRCSRVRYRSLLCTNIFLDFGLPEISENDILNLKMEDETVAMFALEPHLAYNTIGKQNDLLNYVHYSYKLVLWTHS